MTPTVTPTPIVCSCCKARQMVRVDGALVCPECDWLSRWPKAEAVR
jgi:uncharacterized Zn finger protein (UPF0148 family)